MNKITFGIGCLCLAIAISGCSRKRNTFINRNWHAVNNEYNILYNGNLGLQQGKQQIDDSYFENFWQILPVERMAVRNTIEIEGTNSNEFFLLAEDKAAKAIQKHSMLISGKEKNPQIDESYLLLGKARYFDQRFIPALDAFNYILHKYPASNTINQAQIWREKTNIRLENDNLAIKNLKRVLDFENLEDQDRADASAAIAQAYINTGSLDTAIVKIKTAATLTKNNEEKGRYYYILGQLYNQFKQRDSANYAFQKVIDLNRKSPREYMINAELEKARNFNFTEGDNSALLLKLQELEENRENRPFLNKIYFQYAEYYNYLDSTDLAISYYNKSLRAPGKDDFLQSVSYETLGNINFKNASYRLAGQYYDSTLTKIPKTNRDYFVIERKRKNLEEVIRYEDIAYKNDSIIRLVNMTQDQRVDYFTSYAEGLKQDAIEKAKTGIVSTSNPAPNIAPLGAPGMPPALGAPNPGNVFYFYNINRVATGMQEFVRTWGGRPLTDNWRYANNAISTRVEGELDEVSNLIIENNPQFDPLTYVSQIPTDKKFIDSISALRNESYYNLGVIYKDKFGENRLATEKLDSLLSYTQDERLVVPANYYLYGIYTGKGETEKAEQYKQLILNKYPESRYSRSLTDPNYQLESNVEAGDRYTAIYRKFENSEYQEVISDASEYIQQYPDDLLVPKLELLKANAIGRLQGFDAYKEALSYVASNYPQSEAGEKALQLFNTGLPQMANKVFIIDSLATSVKMIFQFKDEEKQSAVDFQKKLEQALQDLNYSSYTVSRDVYTANEVFVVIHNIENIERARGFAELLKVNKNYLVKKTPVLISSNNYRIVQLHKNFDAYLEESKNFQL